MSETAHQGDEKVKLDFLTDYLKGFKHQNPSSIQVTKALCMTQTIVEFANYF